MSTKWNCASIVAVLILLSVSQIDAASQTIIPGPAGSLQFGSTVTYLPNGNFVVTDPSFSSGGVGGVGGVFLYSPSGTLINQMTGSLSNDQVGSSVTVLSNGDYVVSSGAWNFSMNGVPGGTRVGAVTKCSGVSGCPAQVTPANSLVGQTASDQIGLYITALSSGNYVVGSPSWRPINTLSNVGASTFCNGTTNSCANKTISASNSLVGNVNADYVGIGNVTLLTNGDYVVFDSAWHNSSPGDTGFVTRCPAATGCSGTVSSVSSLTGSLVGELNGVTALPNNKFLVSTPNWYRDASSTGPAGAVTLCNNNTNDCMGQRVSASNSLIGGSAGDAIGGGDDSSLRDIWILPNGDYVVGSRNWDIPGQTPILDVGAVTLCRAATNNCAGQVVTPANSLTGNIQGSSVGVGKVTLLSNGNYVVSSPNWRPTFQNQGFGAATLCLAASNSCGGTVVSATNSLVGGSVNDFVSQILGTSSGVTALPNGGYVVSSPSWSPDYDHGVVQAGAVTMCSAAGCVGNIVPGNSLTGTHPTDYVGAGGTTGLTNSSYVVNSPYWVYEVNSIADRYGAATLCTAANSCAGQNISFANSLTGAKHGDLVSLNGTVALSNGNYVVVSSGYDSSVADVGAVTFCNTAVNSCSGQSVSPSNSVVGVSSQDLIGGVSTSGNHENFVKALPSGNYVITSKAFDNGAATDAGAVTIGNGNGGTIGPIGPSNSVIGTTAFEGNEAVLTTNALGTVVFVGLPKDNKVVLFGAAPARRAGFDYDGDGKTDESVFRPSNNVWYLNRSQAGFTGYQFGAPGDLLTPADFTGDGKTDVAVFRPLAGAWFVLKSEDNTFYSANFGSNGDIPAPGDFDGDGKADTAVFRPSTGYWFIQQSTAGFSAVPFGTNGDVPTLGDFDGDGKTDVAVFRPSNGVWYRLNSSNGSFFGAQFGQAGDKVVPADYTGDGKTDLAVWRPSNGTWYIQRSEDNSFYGAQFGSNGDLPAPGDYDGDGKADTAVFRPSDGNWYEQRSTSGFTATHFGTNGDKPTPNAYVF